MATSSTLVTQLQKCQRRLLQALLLGVLLWLRVDPDQRRKFIPWFVGASSGVLGVILLLEASRCFCRTPAETFQLLARTCWTLSSVLVQYVARGFKPKFPNWSLRFELVRGVMRTAADMFGARIVDGQQPPVFRRHSELLGSFLGWLSRKRHGLRLEPVVVNGLEHLWLKAAPSTTQSSSRKRFVVLFYHGGGYAVLSPRMYIPFCSNLLVAVKRELQSLMPEAEYGVEIFLANYRKVPEHRFPVPAEDAVAMYEYLLQHEKLESSQIILVGDSAGGGLVLSTLLRVRDGKSSWRSTLPLPLAAVVACPLADLTGDEDRVKGQHCVLSPSIIAASVGAYHPTHEDSSTWADASPVHCDLRGLPPVLLQAASLDYLFGHSTRLAAKAEAAGVTNWDVDIHDGMTHVFMVFPGYILPYARVGVQRMAQFAATQFLTANATTESEFKENQTTREPKLPSAAA